MEYLGVTPSINNEYDSLDYSREGTHNLTCRPNHPTSNVSENACYTDDVNPPYKLWETIIITICTVVLILGTVIGNTLVCVAVGKVKKLRKQLHNTLLVSLAVSDLLVAVCVMPLALINELMGVWIFGVVICDIYTLLDVLLCTASILNLCAISLDRYFLVEHPFWYGPKRTKKTIRWIITVTWALSILISIPPIFGWKSDADRALIEHGVCLISQDLGYQVYATGVAFYLPLIIMLTVYIRIYIIADKICSNKSVVTKTDKTNMKRIKTLGVIMGTFIVCWLPFFICAVIRAFCECPQTCIPRWVNGFVQWLGYLNSLFNPVIYVICNREFRKPFKELLSCRCRGINAKMRSETYYDQYCNKNSQTGLIDGKMTNENTSESII
ncbi:unnamed protein product [Owenia fusiformis]|uniref:Uncharacterized protein n=1 Tax=Owenia fusiformis TaxID=6347 RepID=A0A8J1UXM3_OWEFU|nr:unnamed protein product [Owenia fusiformis]